MSCEIPSNSSPLGFCCEFSFSSPLHGILSKKMGKADNEDALFLRGRREPVMRGGVGSAPPDAPPAALGGAYGPRHQRDGSN